MALDYNVVFEYTHGTHKGIRTITSFDSKEAFDKWYEELPEDIRELNKVVAEGVSDEEAIGIVEEVPKILYIGAAMNEAAQFLQPSIEEVKCYLHHPDKRVRKQARKAYTRMAQMVSTVDSFNENVQELRKLRDSLDERKL